jgi:hypothetical protein
MAQTKSRTSRSSSRSRSSNRRSKANTPRKSAPKRGSSSRSSSGSRANNSQSQSAVGVIAQKAKGPALAGGAALLGLAGGIAASRGRKRNGVLSRIPTPSLSKPKLNVRRVDAGAALRTIGKAAGGVADRSQQIGEIASEIQKASDTIEKRR